MPVVNGFGPNSCTAVEVIFSFLYIRPKTLHLQLQSCCTAQPVWAQVPNRPVLSQRLCYMAPSFARRWSLSWKCFNSNRCRGEEVCVCLCVCKTEREREGEGGANHSTDHVTQPVGHRQKATNLLCLSFLPFSPYTCFAFLRKDKHTLWETLVLPCMAKFREECCVWSDDTKLNAALFIGTTVLKGSQCLPKNENSVFHSPLCHSQFGIICGT